jgi:hypothetical protein
MAKPGLSFEFSVEVDRMLRRKVRQQVLSYCATNHLQVMVREDVQPLGSLYTFTISGATAIIERASVEIFDWLDRNTMQEELA